MLVMCLCTLWGNQTWRQLEHPQFRSMISMDFPLFDDTCLRVSPLFVARKIHISIGESPFNPHSAAELPLNSQFWWVKSRKTIMKSHDSPWHVIKIHESSIGHSPPFFITISLGHRDPTRSLPSSRIAVSSWQLWRRKALPCSDWATKRLVGD